MNKVARTLWDLLAPGRTKKRRRRPAAAPRRSGLTALEAATDTPAPLPAGITSADPTCSMQDRYTALVAEMKAAYRVRIRKWRNSTSGCAWEVHYRDGSVVRLIESPLPRGPMSCAVFLHEIGHHAIGFGRYRPRCLEEYHAWRWALEAMRARGLNVTPAVEKRMAESLRYAVDKARRRGLKRVPEELLPFVNGYCPHIVTKRPEPDRQPPTRTAKSGDLLLFGIGGLALSFLVPSIAQGQATDPSVFVLNNVSDSVASFTMNPDGSLNFAATTPTSDGPLAAAISPDGVHLAVTHGTQRDVDEDLEIFRVGVDGSLTLVLTAVVPDAPLAAVWLDETILAVSETSFGGNNFIHTYAFDAAAPALNAVDSGFTGGFGTSLAVHPGLPLVYGQDSLGNTVTWFEHAPDGTLTLLGTVSSGPSYPLDLALSGDGARLYAGGGISNAGRDVLAFEVDSRGVPGLHPESPFISDGTSPASVAVSRDDALVFVGHGSDATVRSFFADAEGGLVSTGFSFDVGLQGTLGDLAVLGDFLLFTDESTAIDGIAGLYSFRIHEDGSFTPVDAISDTNGVRPEAIVVWDPRITGDINLDGVVDFEDLLQLLALWGHRFTAADLNENGVVDFADLLILLANWTG